MITSDDVCCNIRNVKFIKVMQFKQMFITAVCVLFLLKVKWPKSKNFYEASNFDEFKGKDCVFVADWFKTKGLHKLCSVFEGV